jgi:hypothetical protein
MDNRGDLRSLCRQLIDEPIVSTDDTAGGFWKNSQLNLLMNQAYRTECLEIATWDSDYYMKTSTVTSVVGSNVIALPSDCTGKINYLYDLTNSRYLGSGDDRFYDMVGSGTPFEFVLQHKNILLDCLADEAISYSIRYYYVPPKMTSDTAVPDFPNGFEDIIAYKTAILAKVRSDDSLGSIQQEYQKKKYDMKNHIMTRQNRSQKMVKVGFSNDGITVL